MIREFHQIDLSGRNSFGVGQQAARLAEFETEEDLRTIFSGGVPERWAVLSGGNNILFTRDYDGLLLTPVARQITPLGEEGDTVRVRADAGVEWDDLVEWAVERGLWGIENLSLIPGKAGAAPVQNIGAYGCEAKDVIERVHMFCTDNRSAMVIDAGHCCFGYRESIFKHELRGRVIITAVDIRLSRTPRPRLGYGDVEREVEARGGVTLRNIREAICAIRRAKLPDPKVTGNAGSFFKNPVVDECVARQLQAQWPDMPVYPGGGMRRQGETGGRLAHRQDRAERLQARKGRRPRTAGPRAGESGRRDGRRSDRLRPHGADARSRKIRHRNRHRGQYILIVWHF